MKLPIGRIVKESYLNVWEHKLEWFRVGFAPFLIFEIANIIINAMYPEPSSGEYNLEITPLHNFAMITIIYSLIKISLSINGYRYAILQERGEQWFTLNLNNRFGKTILYYLIWVLLYFLLIVPISLVLVIFPLFFSWAISFPQLPSISSYPGLQNILDITGMVFIVIVTALVYAYIYGRMAFTFLFISIDQKKPIGSSWRLLKGNVLRLLAILLFTAVPIVLLEIGGLYGITWAIDMRHSGGSSAIFVPEFLFTFFTFFTMFIYWAVGTKAFALAYQALAKEEPSSTNAL